MKSLKKKISALVLTTVFASMQLSYAAIDTGLGGQGGAVINNTQGGFVNVDGIGTGNVDLNFNGNAHVNWDSLNVNKGESLNFNAVQGVNGITVLNTVNSGMSTIAGQISANNGIAKLIISNPNGMLFNGATFDATGDVMLTTQALNAAFNGDQINIIKDNKLSTGTITIQGSDFTVDGNLGISVPVDVITIQDSNFSVGGEFNVLAPSINVVGGEIATQNGMKLVTENGQDYIADGFKDAVRMEAVNIDGDVYIVSKKGTVKTVGGGTINGNLTIDSDDSVSLNYVANGKALHVKGDVDVKGNGVMMYARNTKVDGNLSMENGGGFLEVGNVQVGKDMNLKTTAKSENVQGYKHFVHVVGDNTVGGNLNIESENNIHIGNYNYEEGKLLDGSLTVGGDATVHAINGHIMVTVDMSADKISLKSDNLNVLTDGNAVLKANEYQFSSNGYLGGLSGFNDYTVDDVVIAIMEGYIPIPNNIQSSGNINIAGGTISMIETPNGATTNISSLGDVKLTGANAGQINIEAPDKYIEITGDVKANTIKVGNKTDKLKVDYPSRDYELKYTNIRDAQEVTVKGDEEITYELTNGENGYNVNENRADDTTYLVGPDKEVEPTPEPEPEPEPTPDPEPTPEPSIDPEDNENVKVLRSYERMEDVNKAQPYTPVAYAADLDDDQEDNGVRKNVDGSVTVVKTYAMGK